MDLVVSPKKVIKFLSWLVIILTLVSILGQFYKYFIFSGQDRYMIDMINLDKEKNFPTFYATLMLVFCSVLLFVIYYAKRADKDKFFWHWFGLALLFFLMSMDEILQLHEQIISPLRSLLNTSGYFHMAWTIPAIIFGVIFLIAYTRFLIHLTPWYRNMFIIAGAMYVFGAVGLEILGSKHIYEYGQENISYSLITTIEEVLEMIGVLLFIYTLLNYLNSGLINIKIAFKNTD